MEFTHVNLTINGSRETGWSISGPETFALKEHIKSAGGKWETATRTWRISAGTDCSALWKHLTALSVERAASVEAIVAARRGAQKARVTKTKKCPAAETPEIKKQRVLAALEIKAKTGKYHWVCCEQCEVINWEKGYTSCLAHAEDYGLWKQTFRIFGVIYTGD